MANVPATSLIIGDTISAYDCTWMVAQVITSEDDQATGGIVQANICELIEGTPSRQLSYLISTLSQMEASGCKIENLNPEGLFLNFQGSSEMIYNKTN